MRRLPLHVALARWEDYAKADLAPGSREDYGYWLLRFFWQTHTDPYEAAASDLAGFLGSLGERGPSRQMARQALRHFFGWLAGSGYREANPAAFLPRTRKRHRPVPHWFTEREITRFTEAGADYRPRWACEFVFILGGGFRASEFLAMRTTDVDLDKQTAHVRRAKNRRSRVVVLGSLANSAAVSLVGRNGNGRLTGLTTQSALWDRMRKIGRLAGLPPEKCHPHALRHTCGTLMAERMWRAFGAVDVVAIANHLGHTDLGMALVYQHMTDPRAKSTADLI